MSTPDDPYAPPTGRPADRAPRGGGPVWGPPTGPARPGAVPPPQHPGGGLGVAALVLGLLALVSSATIVGGLLLGLPAVALGLRGRARARTAGSSSGTAVAGAVLGLLGLLVSSGLVVLLSDEVADYRGCRKESVSIVQDQACQAELERAVQAQFS